MFSVNFRSWVVRDPDQTPDQGQDLGHDPEVDDEEATAAAEADRRRKVSGKRPYVHTVAGNNLCLASITVTDILLTLHCC